MAERLDDINQEININVNETGADNAASDFDKLQVNIEETTKASKKNADQNTKTKTSLKDLDGQTKVTTKTFSDLDKKFDEVYGDLQPLTTRLGEAEDRLYELALAGETTSEEFDGLLKKVANYRKVQIETDRTVDAAATTLGQKLGGASQIAATGISTLTSGYALFGGQSEEVEKQLLKVQAAMAFADSISSLSEMNGQFTVFKGLVVDGYKRIFAAKQLDIAVTTEATVAQRILNITALANPYIAVAAAVTALVAVTYIWIKSNKEQAKVLEIANKAVGDNKAATEGLAIAIEYTTKATEGYNTIELARARAMGATDEQIQKLIQSQKELEVQTTRTFASEAYKNILKAQEALRAAQKAGDKDLIKDAEDNLNNAQNLYKSANDAFNEAIISEAENRLTVQGDILQKEKGARLKAIEERKKIDEEERKRLNDEANEAGRLAEERYAKEIKDYVAFRLKLVEAKVQAEFDESERLQATIEEVTATVDAKNEADDSEKERIRIAREKQQEESKDRFIKNGEDLIANSKTLAGKNKAIQKAAIIAEGGVNAGKTVANTAAAIASDLKLGFPANIAPIAFDVAVGATSLASTIKGTNDALKAVGGGSVSSSGTTQGISGAPTRNVAQVGFQGSSENQIANAVAASQKNQPPIEAFVVSQSMTDQQELDRKKELNNSF